MSQQTLNRILLVEDDEDICAITRELLELLGGFTVEVSRNGREALGVLPSFNPDLILCDVMMPEMDGLATLKRLKHDPTLCNIPFVFMSALVQKHQIEEYKMMGAVDVINKPFDPVALPDMISTIWAEL